MTFLAKNVDVNYICPEPTEIYCLIICGIKLLDINDHFSQVYPGWVQAAVDERTPRQAGWTESVAVGGMDFVEKVKEMLGGRAWGRRVHT